MSRRRKADKRKIYPDTKYKNITVQRFINALMLDGKKSVAEKIFYEALASAAVKAKMIGSEIEFFLTILSNVRPRLEVRSRRVGGANYQVPTVVREERAVSKSIKWVVDAARKRSERSMIAKLSAEMLDAFNSRGAAVKKREDTEKMAEANKAFAHYSW